MTNKCLILFILLIYSTNLLAQIKKNVPPTKSGNYYTIVTNRGVEMYGQILERRSDTIVFKSNKYGTLILPKNQIESLDSSHRTLKKGVQTFEEPPFPFDTNQRVIIKTKKNNVLKGKILSIKGDTLIIRQSKRDIRWVTQDAIQSVEIMTEESFQKKLTKSVLVPIVVVFSILLILFIDMVIKYR